MMNYGARMRSIAGQLQSLTGKHVNRVIGQSSYRHLSSSSNDDSRHAPKRTVSTNAMVGQCSLEQHENATATTTSPASVTTMKTVNAIPDAQIKKSVFISQSHDIFTNLALEDWFYRHSDFTNHHALLLWSNDPCVVVGRHQNPFGEANIARLQETGIAVARRASGGGAVYQDRGNLNMTFYTPRERYNRNYNLNILTRALFREWGIKAEVSSNDYILVNDRKVSSMHMNRLVDSSLTSYTYIYACTNTYTY